MLDFFKKKSAESLVLVVPDGTKLVNPKQEIYIGRNAEECDIVVENKSVSKKHLRLTLKKGKWILEDLNSMNGTWVNGERVSPMQPIALNSGDRICIALSAVFYLDEKPAEEKYTEDVEYETNIAELERIIRSVKNDSDGNVIASEHFGRLIHLLCKTPLFVQANIDDTKPEEEKVQVVLFKAAQDEIVPVFTRKHHADAFGNRGTALKLAPEQLMLLLKQLGEHIAVNPNAEEHLVIPKDIFKTVIFEDFIKQYRAKVSLKKYQEKNDVFAVLVCEYNMATEQAEKMKLISAILEYMQDNLAWVPCNADYSEEDYNKIKDLKAGDTFSFENTKFKPDMLKHTSGQIFFPLFSQKEEAPADYADGFSWVKMPIAQCCRLAKNNPDCNGIIVNAFTNSLLITNELIEIILNHLAKN